MDKRLFLQFGAASLGSTLAGCLATAPAGSNGEAPAGTSAPGSGPGIGSADAGASWDSLRTPPSGIPSAQAQQSARQAFERAASGQLSGPTELPPQALQSVATAQSALERALTDFERRWASIEPLRRQAAMARAVTPSVAEVVRQMVRVADQQTRPAGGPSSPSAPTRPGSAASRTSTGSSQSQNGAASTAPEVLVPPAGQVRFNIKGYCLDANLPAPVQGDLAYLAPVGTRIIAPALAPLYDGAASWIAQSPQNTSLAQQLYWALAHAGTNSPWATSPSAGVRKAFDEIAPGGANTFATYHTTELAKREVLKAVLKQAGLDRYVGADQIARGDYAGATQRVLEQQIALGTRMPSQKGQGYSWLAPGVAARTTGSGPLGVDVEILNTSNQPYRFLPASFMAQPADRKQPVALPARLTGIMASALPGGSLKPALDRMFTALEERLGSYFQRPTFAGAFDWMLTPPRFDMSMSRAWARLQDLDNRYPLKASIGALPVIGNALSLYEGFTGNDWLYNNRLPDTERVIALASVMPGEATIVQGLKALERSGSLKALGRVPGLGDFARELPYKVEKAIDSAVFQAGWMPLRGAMRNARNENNANATAAVRDPSINPLQMLSNANLGLPTQVVDLLRQQSPNWPALMGQY